MIRPKAIELRPALQQGDHHAGTIFQNLPFESLERITAILLRWCATTAPSGYLQFYALGAEGTADHNYYRERDQADVITYEA